MLENAPTEIVLRFGENVEIPFGSIRLFDSNSDLIVLSTPSHLVVSGEVDSKIVRVAVPALKPGSYLVVWRVVSADSHPVQGAFAFQIGTTGVNLNQLGEKVLESSEAPILIRAIMGFARWLTFLGVIVMIGAMLLSTRIVIPSRVGKIISRSWLTSVLGSLLVLFMQAPYALGQALSVGEMISSVDDVLKTRLGFWLTVRAVILLIFAVLIWKRESHSKMFYKISAVLSAAILLTTFSISGHPGMRQYSALSIGTDVVHLICVSAWMGGLLTLVILGREWQTNSPGVISWFSFTATITMPIMVATGVAQAWRMMDGLQNIFSTDYGVVLSVKVALVLVAIAVGTRARQLFKSKKVDTQDLKEIKFSRTIILEGTIGLVVLLATAVLVSVSPLSLNSAKPFTATLVQANVIADLTVTPSRVGEVEVHVVFSTPGGVLQPITAMTGRISLASGDGQEIEIPAIPIDLQLVGVSHFQAKLQVPRAGSWLFELFTKSEPNKNLRFSQKIQIVDVNN